VTNPPLAASVWTPICQPTSVLTRTTGCSVIVATPSARSPVFQIFIGGTLDRTMFLSPLTNLCAVIERAIRPARKHTSVTMATDRTVAAVALSSEAAKISTTLTCGPEARALQRSLLPDPHRAGAGGARWRLVNGHMLAGHAMAPGRPPLARAASRHSTAPKTALSTKRTAGRPRRSRRRDDQYNPDGRWEKA
jgi:hypothetical protein